MVAIIVWLIIGGICGWLASIIMRTNAQQGIILNIVVGIIGAVIANFLFNRQNINGDPLNLTSFLWSLLGAVLLLGVVNLVRRGRLR